MQKTQLETELTDLKSKLKYTAHLAHFRFHTSTDNRRQDPSKTVQRHIRLLHEYNEIKDVALGLMGLIAEARGVRLVEVQREYGVKEQD